MEWKVRRSKKEEALAVRKINSPFSWHHWVVAESNSILIARASICFGKVAWFNHAFVQEPYRNQGIYTAMVEARLEWAKEKSMPSAVAYCTIHSAPRLLKMGFQEVGPYIKNENTTPMLFVEKEL